MHGRPPNRARSLLAVLALVALAGCAGAVPGTDAASETDAPERAVHLTLRNDANASLTYAVSVGGTPPEHATLTYANDTTARVGDFPPGVTRNAPDDVVAASFSPAGAVTRTYTLTAGSTMGTRISGVPADPVVRVVVTDGTHVVFYGTAYCADGVTETLFLGVDAAGGATTGMQCGPAA